MGTDKICSSPLTLLAECVIELRLRELQPTAAGPAETKPCLLARSLPLSVSDGWVGYRRRRCSRPGAETFAGEERPPAMAAKCALSAPSFLAHRPLCRNRPAPCRLSPRAAALRVCAAKLPPGVEVPRVQPKLSEPFLGFTQTAEIWNSRACMIGLIGTFIVELVLNKGILQMIGVEVGKGLDLPL